MSAEQEPPDPTARMRKVIVAAAGVSVVLLLAAVGAAVHFAATFEMFEAVDLDKKHPDSGERMGLIRGRLRQSVPASATDPHGYREASIDSTAEFYSFRLPLSELVGFRAKLGEGWTGELGEPPRRIPEEVSSWWCPGKGKLRVLKMERHPEVPGLAGTWWIVDEGSGRVFVIAYS